MGKGNRVTNVVFSGLGGQGVLKASDILSVAVFLLDYDVKKSEVHGMSQRGGSVTSDVRFGPEVFSPMVPEGEADFLVALDTTQIEPARHVLRDDGVLIDPGVFLKEGQTEKDLDKDESTPVTRRNLNVALLGVLSTYLDLGEDAWLDAIRKNLPAKVHAQNEQVFALGRDLAQKT